MRQRVAGRVAQRTQQLKGEGRNKDEITTEVKEIRVAGELEQNTLEAVSRSFSDRLGAGICRVASLVRYPYNLLFSVPILHLARPCVYLGYKSQGSYVLTPREPLRNGFLCQSSHVGTTLPLSLATTLLVRPPLNLRFRSSKTQL